MQQLRSVGIVLFVFGAMCAIAAAAKMPADGQRLPDTWPVFAFGVAISAVGLVLWHRYRRGVSAAAAGTLASERAEAADDAADRSSEPISGAAATRESASSLLRQLLGPLSELESAVDRLGPEELIGRLDELNDRFVLPFVERRSELLDELGMAAGSEVLVTAAYGERMLNRAWSAAADDCICEARQSVRDARSAFQQAVQQLDHLLPKQR